MKRSKINNILRNAHGMFRTHAIHLPQWAYWEPQQWQQRASATEEIRAAGLGWDITDFGLGDFAKFGLLLFTVRNGVPGVDGHTKPYAEKMMVVQPGQVTPLHFHWAKMEDIINRGGGTLVMQLYRSTASEELDQHAPIRASIDGIQHEVPAGAVVRLAPGESICLPQRLYHAFWAEDGACVVGEVSMVNDDHCDNRFYQRVGRFPEIVEDESPLHLLSSDLQTSACPENAANAARN